MNTRVSFYTIGCRLNQAETAILQQSFKEQGYQVVDVHSPADVVVINTCTVTENSEIDTRKLVHKIVRQQPDSRIALVGCQAQLKREALLDMPNVQWVIGNSQKMEFARILRESYTDLQPQVLTPVIQRQNFVNPAAGIDVQHTRANLKIQDGCDFFCSFCVIPYVRGRARSRIFADILQEAEQLAVAGHREIVLTGINIGLYSYQGKSLMDVIDALEKIDGIARIRISSIELSTISMEIVERMSRGSKLCRHLHIPLQSGSDLVLKAMRRKYSVSEYADFIWKVHQRVAGVCLGTDVIVGFPGETEDDFEMTYRLLSDLPLSYFHVFSYSDRPVSRSRKMEPKISREIIERRSQVLRELSNRKREHYLEEQIGSVKLVLFEQQKGGWWSGLTDTYVRVKVKAAEDLRNQIRWVEFKEVNKKIIVGEVR